MEQKLASDEIFTPCYSTLDEGQYFVEDLRDSRLTYVNFGILTIVPTEIDERIAYLRASSQ